MIKKYSVKLLISFFICLMSSTVSVQAVNVTDSMVARGLDEGLKKNIFLDLRDINVVDVLKFLALEGNINIVTSRSVQGRSTLLLRNVPIGDALEIIVVSNSLAYDIKGEIIYVMTEDEYFQLYGKNYNDQREVVTRSLQYAKPSYVLTALQSIQSAIGKVIIDEETGKVIIIEIPSKILEMDALLDQMEEKMETRVYTLQYANAKDVEAQLQSRLQSINVGNIMGDVRSNQIMVSAYPDRLDEIMKLVKKLDQKTKAVSIEAKILQLTLNPTFDFGIDWQKNFRNTQHKFFQKFVVDGSFPISPLVSTATNLNSVGSIAIGSATDQEFELGIKAMKEVKNSKVLASPRLMIVNREEARINIGDKIPYVVTTTTGTGNNVSISEEIKFIDVGLLLVVRPVINDDGYITMNIRPEISSKTGDLITPSGSAIPQVNTTFLETSVIVKDGVSMILGGLRRDDLNQDTKGVPYLMNVPVLGNAFKSRDESMQKTEIVIFMTPKIVDGGVNYTAEALDIKRGGHEDAAAFSGISSNRDTNDFMNTTLPIRRSPIPSRSAA
jgi:type IV pilus assembly protein PilQ